MAGTYSEKHQQQNANHPLVKGIHAISTLCGIIASFMIVTSVLITCQMIWVRFVFNQSTIWQTELVVYLMISATVIGLPYVQLLRGHVNVDLLQLLIPKNTKKALLLTTLFLTFVITAILTYFSFELFHTAWSRNWKSDTVWGVRLWIPYSALPIGFSLYMLQLVADAINISQEANTEDKTNDRSDNGSANLSEDKKDTGGKV